MFKEIIERYWFLACLVIIFTITLADTTETVSAFGKWLKNHRGPDAVIFFIFLFSGFILNISQIKTGLKDLKGILITLFIIFCATPLIGALFSIIPLPPSIIIGIFLVAVMPTTLSSGVVMTGAAGGNMAQALVITLLANSVSVMTIPVILSLLLNLVSDTAVVSIDKAAIMIKIGLVVLVPLCLGLLIKGIVAEKFKLMIDRRAYRLQIINQCLVLAIVWMALSDASGAIIQAGNMFGIIFIAVFLFHGLALLICGAMIKFFNVERGRMESIIFMGGQKTLPLSVILQVTLFPQYGLALAVCVMHHVVHLIMDGYIVAKMTPQ